MKRRKGFVNRRLRRARRKFVRALKLRRNRSALIASALLVVLVTFMTVRAHMPGQIDPTAYTPLLNTIAAGESGGNYNAYYGHGGNTDIQFTDMTVDQVLAWQKQYVAGGSVGRYQIIRPTLEGLVAELHLDTEAKFTPALQDQLAITLLERRGAIAYAHNKLSQQAFTANLAKEWASLPRMTGPDPAKSYYAGDGINAARVSIPAVNQAADLLRSKAQREPR
jgi:muramidase (phage lysozyme)